MSRRWRVCDADWNHWPDGVGDVSFLASARALGLDGVELGVYRAADELSETRLAALRAIDGPPVEMLLLSLPVDRWPGGALSGSADQVAVEAAAVAATARTLGLGTIGVWPGADPPGADIRAGLTAVAAAAGDVRIAVEYKPGTAVATADEALDLAAAVPGTGVLLDTGHAWAAGEDPADVVRRLADLLWHLHLGDADDGDADADLPLGRRHDPRPLVDALDEIGYRGAASFDLYGSVCAGTPGVDAVRESLTALRGRQSRP